MIADFFDCNNFADLKSATLNSNMSLYAQRGNRELCTTNMHGEYYQFYTYF